MAHALIVGAIAGVIATAAIAQKPAPALSQHQTPQTGRLIVVSSFGKHQPQWGQGLRSGTKILVTTTTATGPGPSGLGNDNKLYRPLTTGDLKKMDLNRDNTITVRELRTEPVSIATVTKGKNNKLQYNIDHRTKINEITYGKHRVTVTERNGTQLRGKSVTIRTLTPNTPNNTSHTKST